jgi:hypothetical protein
VLIPILYLTGLSTGGFEEALTALLGKDAGGLSASTISWLKEAWSEEHVRWSKRDLSTKRYVLLDLKRRGLPSAPSSQGRRLSKCGPRPAASVDIAGRHPHPVAWGQT